MKKYIAFISFGKDSTAMLLLLLEKHLPLDEVVFFNTGKEFNSILKMRDSFIPILKERKIKFTELHPAQTFDYFMFEHQKKNGKHGYGWCGGNHCRYFTGEKLKAFKPYDTEDIIQYVGIAKDETIRLKRLGKNKIAPLELYNMTEKDCLEYCYSRGYIWYEKNIRLYDILDRVSCWCCASKNLKELLAYKNYLPDYYEKLKSYERIIGPMKPPYYLEDRLKWYKEHNKQ